MIEVGLVPCKCLSSNCGARLWSAEDERRTWGVGEFTLCASCVSHQVVRCVANTTFDVRRERARWDAARDAPGVNVVGFRVREADLLNRNKDDSDEERPRDIAKRTPT